LPANTKKRSPGPKIKLYEKQTPGHHVQMDVKFLTFTDKDGKRIKRYQYTAIDDATRIRALKVYKRHNQENAIDFLDYVIKKFPFRIKMIRTDNGHEFQAKFHWYCMDKGIEHVYIKPGSPKLNGKVERSHRTDKQEFYQLIEYKSDVDLSKKIEEWEKFYNFNRPHLSHGGLTPYEVFRAKMNIDIQSQQKLEV
jgi:transposase InsO family protein